MFGLLFIVSVDRQNDGVEHPAAWDERVVHLVAFVEADRELKFDHPVLIEYVSHDAMIERYRSLDPSVDPSIAEVADDVDASEGGVEEDSIDQWYRAWGLAEGHLQTTEASSQVEAAIITAFYAVESQTIIVTHQGEVPDVLPLTLQATMVHELVHALRHQQSPDFGVEPPVVPQVAIALAEGEANLIEDHFVASLSDEDLLAYWTQVEAEVGQSADAVEGVAPILLANWRQPYILGANLAGVIWAVDGPDGLNALFNDPPPDTRALIDPWAYVDGLHHSELYDGDRVSPPEGAAIIGEPFAERDAASWFYTLRGALSFEHSLRAARDAETTQAQQFTYDDAACFTVALAGDESGANDSVVPERTVEFHDGLRVWAETLGDARTFQTADTGYSLTGCDPGPDADLALPASFVDDLWAITFVTMGESWAVANGLPRETGACVALGVIEQSSVSPLPENWYHFDELTPQQLSGACSS